MKSTTAPKRMRSITLPMAPPAMAPRAIATSRVSARRSQRPRATTIASGDGGEQQRAPAAIGLEQAEGDALVPHHGEAEHRQQVDAAEIGQAQDVE